MLSEFCDAIQVFVIHALATRRGRPLAALARSVHVHFLDDAVHSHLYAGYLGIDAEAEGRAT
jgi:hypothetical protein